MVFVSYFYSVWKHYVWGSGEFKWYTPVILWECSDIDNYWYSFHSLSFKFLSGSNYDYVSNSDNLETSDRESNTEQPVNIALVSGNMD